MPAKVLTMTTMILLMLLCLLPVYAAADVPTPLLEEGTVYTLSSTELESLMDAGETLGIVFDEAGMRLEDGADRGVHVSGPISMQEFSKLALSWDSESTCEEDMPQVSISVYRPDEDAWSPFIPMQDGEAAGRAKGKEKTVTVRYRIELIRADTSYERQYFRTLIVSGGEQFFTQETLIMLFGMIAAAIVFVSKRRRQRSRRA